MGLTVLGQTNKKILSGRLQRNLRRNMTDAERLLWRELRGRQISGVKFRRQHPFGDYILDFASLEIKLVIEVDGSQHAGLAHPHPGPPLEGEGGKMRPPPSDKEGGKKRLPPFDEEDEHLCDADLRRTKKLETAGFRVLRFWNNEVLADISGVREKIWQTVQELQISQ